MRVAVYEVLDRPPRSTITNAPPEADACSGLAVFVDIPPEGERQGLLWNVDQRMRDDVPIECAVDLNGPGQLSPNPKYFLVFVIRGANRGRGGVERSWFIRYLALPSQLFILRSRELRRMKSISINPFSPRGLSFPHRAVTTARHQIIVIEGN